MIPHLNWPIYSGWVWNTPVIPNMYWNAYTHEQRIKNLWLNMGKVGAYLDTVAEDTNEWIDEVTDELNDIAADVEENIEEYTSNINNRITTFENTVNTNVDEFKSAVNQDITTFKNTTNQNINTFKNQVNSTIDGFAEYASEQGWEYLNYIARNISTWCQFSEFGVAFETENSTKDMLVFGDSYTQPGIANSIDAYWVERVRKGTQTFAHNYAIAGAGWARSTQLISTQEENAWTDAQNNVFDANNVSIIIAMAGCNDLLNWGNQNISENTVSTAIIEFMNRCNTRYPYARVYIIPFNWGFAKLSASLNSHITNIMNTLFMATASTGDGRRGAVIVPYAWMWNLGIATRFRNEVHPNEQGYRVIAGHIMNAIRGGQACGFNTSNVRTLANEAIDQSSQLFAYDVKNGWGNLHGFIRPVEASNINHIISLFAENTLPAILTPNSAVPWVVPLYSSTKRAPCGHMELRQNGSCTLYLIPHDANEVLNFNFTFIPEVGVNWADYTS